MKIIARRKRGGVSLLKTLAVMTVMATATAPALAQHGSRALLATTSMPTTTTATTATTATTTTAAAAPATATAPQQQQQLAKTASAAPMLDPTVSAKMDPAVAAAITGTGTPDPSLVPRQTGVPLSFDGRARGEKRTVEEVNEQAPTFRMPTAGGVVEARPNLAVDMSGAGGPGPAAPAGAGAGAAAGAAAATKPASSPPSSPQFATAADVAAAKKETSDAAAAAAALSARLPGDPTVPVAPSYMAPTNPAYAAGESREREREREFFIFWF